jgi:TonB family protein
VIVPVEVKISESGRVTSAIPEKGSGAVYDYLSTLAAGAARNWRFQPARSHSGAPVPATKTLYFVFTNRD